MRSTRTAIAFASISLLGVAGACGSSGGLAPPDAATGGEDAAADAGAPTGDAQASPDASTDATLFADAAGRDAATAVDGMGPPMMRDAETDASSGTDAAGGICGPANCPLGCCNGAGQCVTPSNDACGWRGSACQQCPANAQCDDEFGCVVMQPTCGPSNCGGCCTGGGTGNTSCFPGTDPITCGFGGAPCTACNPGQECRPFLYDAGGFCQSNSTCDSTNCTGCCIGNVCAQGTQSNACGFGGAACQDCATDVCVDGHCVCGGPTGGPCDAGSD